MSEQHATCDVRDCSEMAVATAEVDCYGESVLIHVCLFHLFILRGGEIEIATLKPEVAARVEAVSYE